MPQPEFLDSLPLLLLLLTMAVGAYMLAFQDLRRIHPLPVSVSQPGLALQLIKTREEMRLLLEGPRPEDTAHNIRLLRWQQYLDAPFLVFYGSLFFVLGWQMTGSPNPIIPLVGWIAMIAAVATVIADWTENRIILRGLRAPDQDPDIRPFGRTKWGLAFATIGLVSGRLIDYPSLDNSFAGVVAWLIGIGFAILGATGLASVLLSRDWLLDRAVGWLQRSLFALLLFYGIRSLAIGFDLHGCVAAPLTCTSNILTLLDLLRFPLITAAMLILLPYLAFLLAPTLLANLFDLRGWRASIVCGLSLMAAWTALLTGWLTLSNLRRFPLAPDSAAVSGFPSWGVAALAGLLVLPIAGAVVLQAARERTGRWLPIALACAAGIVAAAALGLLTELLFNLTEEPIRQAVDPVLVFLEQRFRPEPLTGYSGNSWPLHAFAAIAFGVSLAVYGVLGWLQYRKLEQSILPALAGILLWLILGCWTLSGVAFALDRYHFPLLFLLLVWATLIGHHDHNYQVTPLGPNPPQPPAPAPALLACPYDSAIVIAAAGGGIQAAAWVAQVITGLDQEARRWFPGDPERFSRSLRLISAVSGGSTGAMYVAEGYSGGALPADPEQAYRIVHDAACSSLDQLAWGLVYPDTLKTFLPFVPHSWMGRGRALERAWAKRPALERGLSHWYPDAAAGLRPVVILNGTLVETGRRFLAASSAPTVPLAGRNVFSDLYPHYDLSVVSGARLSATFPFVTPAASASGEGLKGPQPHVVDGGYYDNYGVSSLTDWADEALKGSSGRIRRLLIIEIRAFGPGANTGVIEKQRKGWLFQATAPIKALLAVRGAAQASHNLKELALFERAWQGQVAIERIAFEYDGEDPPLSWHLSPRQQDNITEFWTSRYLDDEKAAVRQFLAGAQPAPPMASAAQG